MCSCLSEHFCSWDRMLTTENGSRKFYITVNSIFVAKRKNEQEVIVTCQTRNALVLDLAYIKAIQLQTLNIDGVHLTTGKAECNVTITRLEPKCIVPCDKCTGKQMHYTYESHMALVAVKWITETKMTVLKLYLEHSSVQKSIFSK